MHSTTVTALAGASLLPALARRSITATALFLAAATAVFLAPLPAHAAPPKAYSKAGVGFQHPAAWKVAADELEAEGAGTRSIDLEGPNEATITLAFIPFVSGQDIDAFAARAAAHRAERDKASAAQEGADKLTPTTLSSTRITRRVGGKEVKGVLHGFGYTANGESVQLQARFFALDFGGASVLIMAQSFAEDAKQVDAALALTMDTLRYRPQR